MKKTKSISIMRDRREALGLSQERLAKELGVHYVTINGIETRHNQPSVALAKKIGAYLGFPWYLLFEEEE